MSKAMHNSWVVLAVAASITATPSAFAQGQEAQLNQLLAARDFDREPQNKTADWTYAMSVASAAQKAWTIQKAASGDAVKRAFDVRSALFIYAAREVLRWQNRYLGATNDGFKFEGRYALASFIGGLYIGYAGDYWQARKYLGFAQAQAFSLKPGQAMPSYNGVRLDSAIGRELDAVDGILARYGSTPPYERIAHFEMSNSTMLDEARAAADFVLRQRESDPKLIEGPASNPVTAEPQ